MDEVLEHTTQEQLCRFINIFISTEEKQILSLDQNEKILTQFISHHNSQSIYIIRFDNNTLELYNNLPSINELPHNISTIVILIKPKGPITSQAPISQQINIVNVPVPSLNQTDDQFEQFEQLRLTINSGLSPYFDFLSGLNEDSALVSIKKKFTELSLSLQHLQQRIQIPDLIISTHPKIKKVIEKSIDIDDLEEDSDTLNEISTITNQWIQQIQSITRLDHKASNGISILEDIQFWNSMESALLSLQQQMNSEEIKLSIDLLNRAKRFHITMRFQNDTELVDKMNHTKQINAFMKELPVDDLFMTNTNFEKFNDTAIRLFSHLKNKLTILPLTRAIANQFNSIGVLLKELITIEWIHLLHADDLQSEAALSENLVEIQSLNKVIQFEQNTTALANQLTKLEKFYNIIDNHYHRLKTSFFNFDSFKDIVKEIQKEFNEICLENIDNTDQLAELINNEIATIFSTRLRAQLFIINQKAANTNANVEVLELDKYNINIPVVRHELFFQEESFGLLPNFIDGKVELFDFLNSVISIVEQQAISNLAAKSRIIQINSETIQDELSSLMVNIDKLYDECEIYLNKWEYLQNLWELDLTDSNDISKIFEKTSVYDWYDKIKEILSLRNLFDQTESFKTFGQLIIIEFSKIQNRVAVNFDLLKKNLLHYFQTKLSLELKQFNQQLMKTKENLEEPLQFHGDAEKLFENIDNYLSSKNNLSIWLVRTNQFHDIQKYLSNQRVKFPMDWLFTEQLQNNLSMITSLIDRKCKLIEENKEFLISKVLSESKKLNETIRSLSKDWEVKKPIAGNIIPSTALLILKTFQTKFGESHNFSNFIINTAESLDVSISFEDLSYILEEIRELTKVWSSVNHLWEDLESLKQLKWVDLESRELYHQLNDLLTTSRSLPSNIRQYPAICDIQDYVKAQLKNQSKISELKSDYMKPRHWKVLLNQLGFTKVDHENLKVVDVWNLNILLNVQTVDAMLEQARNERTLEDSLNAINTAWSEITFELFNYENKCRLIKNWDLLFDQCNTDLNALSSMRNSPYFATFEKEISDLENNINTLFLILDAWIEVQRQWVYLNGVFGSKNNDLKQLLPVESSRFNNISYELLSLFKRLYKFNLVIDIVVFQDLQNIMSRYVESLIKVRKSLSEYLEKQREFFPRFYFIGDEDLLELIGRSHDYSTINKHVKKMFSGIDEIEFDRDASLIVGVISAEGEYLEFVSSVSMIKYPKVHEWLKMMELETKLSLSNLVNQNIESWGKTIKSDELLNVLQKLPAQVSTLLSQISFTNNVDPNISNYQQLCELVIKLVNLIESDISSLTRKKIQYLLIEIIHQREIAKQLTEKEYLWNLQQKFYYDTSMKDPLKRLKIKQVNVEFIYGWEYLGLPEKLAYTPLTDDCYLTMCQALAMKLGGSPFGPAGTGKTETIKALGHNLGKMVIVFNCDKSFDFQSMSRIFLGLCKVGNWGCFDEFNRLDEKSLSAISSQIESIEYGLRDFNKPVSISNREIYVNPETGLFVTMNPGYAGRSELPENLKKLFRSFSMSKPDSEIIVEILLTSQGFKTANDLSRKIVAFYLKLDSELSTQRHYDFGLRALKSMLNRCGSLKRRNKVSNEYELVLESINATIAPKLVNADEKLFHKLKEEYFPSTEVSNDSADIIEKIEIYCVSAGLLCNDKVITKALQLIEIQKSAHGIMLIGAPGSGKSTILHLVANVLSEEHKLIRIDAKLLSTSELFGKLDSITREWTDGLFTSILRKVNENLRNESSKQIWIVFDGDVDPQWAENLNSVLDDNKILTLPNGERIELPMNVRIVFEVDSLKYTTPATISRCGIVWFDESLVSIESSFIKLIYNLSTYYDEDMNKALQTKFVDELKQLVTVEFLSEMNNVAQGIDHVMTYTFDRAITSFETMLKIYLRRLSVDYDVDLRLYTAKSTILSIIWSFAGDAPLESRNTFAKMISQKGSFAHVDIVEDLIDYDVSIEDGQWINWNNRVVSTDLEPHEVSNPNIIVPTLDTVRHESLVYSIINEHRPLILCGPPGSGKTMTLLEALRKSPQLDLISLNFSKDTSPVSLLKALEQFCEYKQTSRGFILTPIVTGKWVVVFCDEINLPMIDEYGSQNIISLMRQMVEQNGFWRTKDMRWITLENVQFVGACNPPNDPGRSLLSDRFLRHVSVIMVDYPGTLSMQQIYQTFMKAILKCAPDLRGFARELTNASIEIYERNKNKFSHMQPHYVYSPRELTRWSKGLLEALKSKEYYQLIDLLRLWYHEGLRLFYDRLVSIDERLWVIATFRELTTIYFPNVDLNECFKSPIFFSDWMDSEYKSVNEVDLRNFVQARLRVFSEEVMDVDLILHDEMLDHVLRIDRVLKQPQGHMILVGPSSSGRSTLAKFVAWMNGLKIEQLSVQSDYRLINFDETLKKILLRCCDGEKICFIIDESTILESSFIERMNTLLANAEIPGLFNDEEYTALMTKCSENSHSQGLLLDTNAELYIWFTQQISRNLHVIFNIDETNTGQSVLTSPALFNRCVLSWMGDWSDTCLCEIAMSKINEIPFDTSSYNIPPNYETYSDFPATNFRDVIIDIISFIHRFIPNYKSTISINRTPNDFLTLIETFTSLYMEKQLELDKSQRHISVGLDKIRDTVVQVDKLKKKLAVKEQELKLKDEEARKVLDKMIVDQNEAERKQEFSIVTQAELEKQEIEIRKRREVVMKDLEFAEPAVLEAQRGVQNIKKQHLTEIRSMSNPPAAVKMTMESVCILLGYDVSSWRDVQLVIRKDDFIPNIVSFDGEAQISLELRNYMETNYLAREDYTFEVVHRASKACGPLLQWVRAQLAYSKILDSIGPLRHEVQKLEQQTIKTKAQLIAIDQMINELEESIENYKESYSQVIRETENIKSEMRVVHDEVERSMTLISNLENERTRWKESVDSFSGERDKLVGNSLLVAAFIAYCGPFDQRGREIIVEAWKHKLINANVKFDSTLVVANYLEKQIMNCLSNGLQNDELYLDNFALIKRSKFPLIIDPSSDVINALTKCFNQFTISSFLNDGLLNQLENSIRFGGAIIIQDCEYYNPILDSLLRNEIQRNGGRTMIKLGKELIDYSPKFKLILFTKEAQIQLSSFVMSRTTIINFTTTSGSLENQTLNIILKELKPDVEKQRVELNLLNSEYRTRLQGLEIDLLDSLNDSIQILDNEEVLKRLEIIKSESDSINEKLSNSDTVIAIIEQTRDYYRQLAKQTSVIYSMIELLTKLSSFYTFPLTRFISEFIETFRRNSHIKPTELIIQSYKEFYSIVVGSLQYEDKVVLTLLFSMAFYTEDIGDVFKQAFVSLISDKDYNLVFDICLAKREPEWDVATNIKNNDNPTIQVLSDLLLNSKLNAFAKLGSIFYDTPFESKYDLIHWIEHFQCLLFTSPIEVDASYKISQLATSLNKKLVVISMGSKEGIENANKELDKSIAKPQWVIIQNVQMSPLWFTQLENKLKNPIHEQSRIFITCSTSTKLPLGLISQTKVLNFEGQVGIKAIFNETVKLIPEYIVENVKLKYLVFLITWFHSLIVERLRYTPVSFKKRHDINDSDFTFALKIINNKMSWDEIKYLIVHVIYGSKIDDVYDLKYIDEFANTIFKEEFVFDDLNIPDGSLIDWIDQLPIETPLSWLNLEPDANDQLENQLVKQIRNKFINLIEI
ncbi:unnamed protein product [Candida verbasci]|uniref:Dynein heavy chain, cytoplasmic n=1 Tax=Candida verbasci TaxID=1227364 RepID=A0A9W4TYB3_9ASCO|nr:unnamed protein product [Candida verbasci]